MSSLDDYRQDIHSLSTEIQSLADQRQTLLQTYKQLSNALQRSQTPEPSPEPTTFTSEKERRDHMLFKRQFAGIIVPPSARHLHFDESIASLFEPEMPAKKQKTAASVTPDFVEENAKTIAVNEQLHMENIYRMGGVTLFPLNEQITKIYFPEEKTDPKDEADPLEEMLLGVRIDLTSQTTKTFGKPHYVILRKAVSLGKANVEAKLEWEVFKHTLPQYISLKEHTAWLNVDLQKFGSAIRNELVQYQYKQDLFGPEGVLCQLRLDTGDKLFDRVETDLACMVVRIFLGAEGPGGPVELRLHCHTKSVSKCEVLNTREGDEDIQILKNVRVIKLLTGDFASNTDVMTRKFKQCVEILQA
ncbi:hypothetical protein BABINDRAFT_7059 [Babjeviella inositovora NRRL Y-12698]|uniref:Uncharacterized protein n=1 Tax=Babjeviella inositovora NRRL Y-12698 TaxID=984486 RepID=A0A1E3QU83_9ASCO|nr:uncharacterized protein BABINDRAFT_7059 [Babjeviella inositovora NRRL Y-12698]ODQ81245.1 hypothetical protein BABINDRAFT_7059 [Babjeviella inositovora NRRL Y-12698]